jgi:hypothetical protein
MKKRILVTDIDGTLSHGEEVHPDVAAACTRLRENGWEIMVATGRILATSKNHIKAIGAWLPAIVYDGARLMDPLTGKSLWEAALSSRAVDMVLAEGWSAPLELQIFTDEAAICRKKDKETRLFLTEADVPVYDNLQTPHVDERVFRIIFYGSEHEVLQLEERIGETLNDHVDVMRSGKNFLDVVPLGVSKGAALSHYLDQLQSGPEILVAAGDHCNDLALFDRAHLRVAPCDAVPQILERAHVVMPPAHAQGFVRLIDFLLSGHWTNSSRTKRVVL